MKLRRKYVYRRWMNIGATIPGGAFGVFLMLMSFAVARNGYGINEFALLLMGLMLLQLGWLALWRPCLVVTRDGLVLRWAFGRVEIPYERVARLVIPPETPGFEIVLDDGQQSRISGFGSSMISRLLGSRQEKRIISRIEHIQQTREQNPDAQVTKQLNWFAILFPTLTLATFITCIIIIENTLPKKKNPN